MTYNLKLFWRMTRRSLIGTAGTHGQLKRKRVLFLILFYAVWPAWTLFTWLCFGLDDLLFPAYKNQPVDKPLFILGNFRSGSTFLHRLLSRDDTTFTSLRTWDIFLTPSITQRKISAFISQIDQKLGGHLKRALTSFDQRSLGQVQIHRISFFKPEEDENILLHAWSTFFVSFMFPFLDELPPYEYFDDQLPADEKRRVMAFYKSCLQRHLYYQGGHLHFASKNPAFSAKIETLAEFFPDARILYLARNPLDMLPSTISWLSYAWGVFSNLQERYPYCDRVLALTEYWYRHPLGFIDRHPSPNRLIVSYDDLIGDPERIIRGFYKQFGYSEHGQLEQIVEQAVEETRMFRSDHVYSYEEMGFTREQIVAAFADIFDRFNFNRREPSVIPAVPEPIVSPALE